MSGFPWLLVALVVPAGAALLLQILPLSPAACRWYSIVAAAITFLLSAIFVGAFLVHHSQGSSAGIAFQFAVQHSWMPQIGALFSIGLDGVGVWLLALNAALFLLAMLVVPTGGKAQPRAKLLFGLMLLTETATAGVILSLDLLLFYFFWEGMLIPLYFLLGGWGGEGRRAATMKFVVYTAAGSLLMLVALIYVAYASHAQYGVISFSLSSFIAHPLASGSWVSPLIHLTPLQIAFLAFGLAFAIKAPLVPFHSWLPASYENAPPYVLTFFAGIVGKLGLFGFIRFGEVIFPGPMHQFQWLLIGMALLSVVWGALIALTETDMKRIVSYASISHIGFIALGIFTLSVVGLSGAVIQMVSHGVVIAGLFLIVWYLEERTGSRSRHDVVGLEKRMPWLYVFFLIITLGALGMPGTSSFVGEFFIMLGAFQVTPVAVVVAGAGVVLACWYMLRIHQGAMHEPLPADLEKVRDITIWQGAALAAVCVVIIVLGIYPAPVSQAALNSEQQYTALAGAHAAAGTTAVRFSVPNPASGPGGR